MEGQTKGTTVVAILFRGGVVVAADRQVTMGHTLNKDFFCNKIFTLGKDAAIGIAGIPGVARPVVEATQGVLKSFERTLRRPVSFSGRLRLFRRVVTEVQGVAKELPAAYLFVGYDAEAKTPRLFYVESSGVDFESPYYLAIGSGAERVHSFLDKTWKEKITKHSLSPDTAITLAEEAIAHAADRNIATCLPEEGINIFVVTKGAIEDLSRIPDSPRASSRRRRKANA